MTRNCKWISFLLALWMALIMPAGTLTSLAASSSKKTISKVTINLDLNLSPGDGLPDLSLGYKGSGSNIQISENEKYVPGDEPKWVSSTTKDVKIGSTYTLKVTLDAVDPDAYAFRGTYTSSNVSVKGGTFVSASRKGYETLVVTIKTKPIEGNFEAPEEVDWKEYDLGHAEWDKVNNVDTYDVTLYRGSSSVYKVKAFKGTKLNFYPYMTSAGTYKFKVRAVPNGDNQKDYAKSSDWTESGELYISKEKVSDGSGKIDYNNNSSAGNTAVNTEGQVGWIQQNGRWWYRYPNGSYQKNSWLNLNNIWYLFDKDGWMLTGWQEKDGYWYYLDASGATRGGWIQASNGWYFLNPSPQGFGAMYKSQWLDYNGKKYYMGENGVMCEGWKKIGDNWFYFYPGEGSMAVNTFINTFYVGPDGVWQIK